MTTALSLSGLYNISNLKWFESLGHDSFELDLRPRSFQFLPHYQAHDLMQAAAPTTKFRVHFENENSLLVEKFIADCKHGGVSYIFSGERDIDIYATLKRPFLIEINTQNAALLKTSELVSTSFFKGFVFDYAYLHYELMNSNIAVVLKQLAPWLGRGSFELGLKVKFDQDVAPSLWDYFQFNACTLDLSSRVETGYRQFSQELFKNEFSKFTSLYPEISGR